MQSTVVEVEIAHSRVGQAEMREDRLSVYGSSFARLLQHFAFLFWNDHSSTSESGYLPNVLSSPTLFQIFQRLSWKLLEVYRKSLASLKTFIRKLKLNHLDERYRVIRAKRGSVRGFLYPPSGSSITLRSRKPWYVCQKHSYHVVYADLGFDIS